MDRCVCVHVLCVFNECVLYLNVPLNFLCMNRYIRVDGQMCMCVFVHVCTCVCVCVCVCVFVYVCTCVCVFGGRKCICFVGEVCICGGNFHQLVRKRVCLLIRWPLLSSKAMLKVGAR